MHLAYLVYFLRHKWYVFVEACKLGIPCLGLVHDWSKVLPDEWVPYARFFYGSQPERNPIGYFYESGIAPAFDLAWLKHIHRNKHHWQWWVLREDSGEVKTLPMPERYQKEMLADWRGAGKAQGYGNNTSAWYQANKDKMRLHPDTRHWVESTLRE